ncbi:IS1595 family transposase (plasmid) [Azospirillum argentinense]|uniref:IS1595 family transposase n=1 Tax=Azospirillum argentinense TaxID=2970906 RepID=A0A4D8PFW4_9PROT|nr:IS1595 family transposase [Azospirillum argentinense]
MFASSRSCTLFAFHKLPLHTYLAAVVIFVNVVKGKSALALSRDLGVQYKTAMVLAHRIREAMGAELRGVTLGGEGHTVKVDGCYVGGHVRPENKKADRKDRRLSANQNGKRRVVAIRERDGRTVMQVFESEAASIGFIKARIERGTILQADEPSAWNPLHATFETKRISYQEAYSLDDACTNDAESFFSRLRRAEIGHHHHISGTYFARYACEASIREDYRWESNGEQFRRVVTLVTKNGPSAEFCGYWQRNRVVPWPPNRYATARRRPTRPRLAGQPAERSFPPRW